MSKDARPPRIAAPSIPVPDIYSDRSKNEPKAGREKTALATPKYQEPDGFDPYDTASLHQKQA